MGTNQPIEKPLISHRPLTSEPEIDRLIALAKKVINNLPKKDPSAFTYQQLEKSTPWRMRYELPER